LILHGLTVQNRYNSLCNPVSKFILPSSPHVPDCDYTSTDENATPSLLGPPKPDYINTPEGTPSAIAQHSCTLCATTSETILFGAVHAAAAFKKEAAASSEGKTRLMKIALAAAITATNMSLSS
jgi:hypothetical protein